RMAWLPLQLEDDPVRRLLPDARDRLKSGSVAARDRPAQLGGRRAGDDRERDLRPDAGDGEEVDKQLPLAAVGEAVELEDVLADVEVRLDRDLVGGLALSDGRGSGMNEVADASHIEHEALGRVGSGLAAQTGD